MSSVRPFHLPKSRSVILGLWSVSCTLSLWIILLSYSGVRVYTSRTPDRLSTSIANVFHFPAVQGGGFILDTYRYNWEVSARKHYLANHSESTDGRYVIAGEEVTDQQVRRFIRDYLLNHALYRQYLKDRGVRITNEEITKRYLQIAEQAGGTEALHDQLQKEYGKELTEEHYRSWISDIEVRARIMNTYLERVTLRHILIAVPQDANEATTERARVRAQNVISRITTAEQFTEVAAQSSDDLATRDTGGFLGTTIRGDLAKTFGQTMEDAAFTATVGQVVPEPIRSQYGWEVLLIERREGTIPQGLDEFTRDLRSTYRARTYVPVE